MAKGVIMLQNENKISITTEEAKALIYVLNRPDNSSFLDSYKRTINWLEENVITGQKFVYRFADLPHGLRHPYIFSRCEYCGYDRKYETLIIDNDDRIQIVKQWYLNVRKAQLKDRKASILLYDVGRNSKYQKLLRQIVECHCKEAIVCEKHSYTRFYFDRDGCTKVADELFNLIGKNAEVPSYIFMARKQMSIIKRTIEKELQ